MEMEAKSRHLLDLTLMKCDLFKIMMEEMIKSRHVWERA